jgi:hypothetical protein
VLARDQGTEERAEVDVEDAVKENVARILNLLPSPSRRAIGAEALCCGPGRPAAQPVGFLRPQWTLARNSVRAMRRCCSLTSLM